MCFLSQLCFLSFTPWLVTYSAVLADSVFLLFSIPLYFCLCVLTTAVVRHVRVDFIVRWCNSEAAFFFFLQYKDKPYEGFFFQHATVFSTPAAELELKCSSRPQQISAGWRRFMFPNSLSLPLECSFAPCILPALCAGWGCAFLLYLVRYVIQEWAIITSLRCLSWVWTWAIQVKLHWLCCILIGHVFCYQQTI